MNSLRVALFVEGTDQSSYSTAPEDPLARLWNERLCSLAGVQRFDHVIGMSKKHLASMDEKNRGLSGVGERFDQLFVRKANSLGFDAAVVAWDLFPRWDQSAPFCRWQETLDLYAGLARSEELGQIWRDCAQGRWLELSQRERPSARLGLTRLQPGMIQALCMDRMFETLLVDAGSSALRRALGIDGRRVQNWPNFNTNGLKHDDLLGMIVEIVRRLRPRPTAAGRVRGGFRDAKHEWASEILSRLAEDADDKEALRSHPIIRRLAEVR